MKINRKIVLWIVIVIPLLAVAFYIRYRPELEDRLLPPIINIRSPLNGSILKDSKVKVEICCERIRTKGYSLTADLNGNRINHKLGMKGSSFSGIVKCNSGYNFLNVELHRQCSPSQADCRPRLLSHEISRFTVTQAKPPSREKIITKPSSEQEPPPAPDREDVELLPDEKAVSKAEPTIAESPLVPGEDSRIEDEEMRGLLVQDRGDTGEEEPLPEEDKGELSEPTQATTPEAELVELYITIETPECNSLTNQPIQDVSGSANPLMQVTYNNSYTGDLRITTATDYGEYFFPSVIFNEGMNQIAVTVSDTEGRTKNASCSLLVDITPPLITIENPRNTSIHPSLNLNVRGATEPNILVEIVDPYSSTRSDGLGNFSFPQVEFNEGSNSLTVRATDAAGNIGTITVNFRIDVIRPEISCERPKELECSDTIGPAGNCEPGSKIEDVARGSQTTCDAEGNFILPNVVFQEGENTLQLRATDPAGNIFDMVLTFVVDTTPPVVTITNPRDGSIINPRTQDITGKTEPFCTVEISDPLSGEKITVMSDEEGIFVIPGVAFPEGDNTLTVKITDRCGWETTFTISFFAEPDFYRVTIDPCDSLENPIDSSEVTQFNRCVYVNLPDEGRSLGAYHLFISYDPDVVQLRRISGGDAVEFSSVSSRVSNSADPETGLATSFFFEANNGRTNWTAPSGMEINVAKLTFNVVDPGTSTLALRIKTLSDNNRQPINGFAQNGFVEVR